MFEHNKDCQITHNTRNIEQTNIHTHKNTTPTFILDDTSQSSQSSLSMLQYTPAIWVSIYSNCVNYIQLNGRADSQIYHQCSIDDHVTPKISNHYTSLWQNSSCTLPSQYMVPSVCVFVVCTAGKHNMGHQCISK